MLAAVSSVSRDTARDTGKGAGFPVVKHFQWLSRFAGQPPVCHVCHL
jgi:hypothetical protein